MPKNKLAVPWNTISEPLEQCRFVMTRIDSTGQPFPVNELGEPNHSFLLPIKHPKARFLWVVYQGEYFDGYSLVLGKDGQVVKTSEGDFYIVVGHHHFYTSETDTNPFNSPKFIADWISLGQPVRWPSPDRKSIYWAGLSPEPINEFCNTGRTISSYNQIIPITTAVSDDENDPPLKVLSESALYVINKWSAQKDEA
jgi:hypothetical protein